MNSLSPLFFPAITLGSGIIAGWYIGVALRNFYYLCFGILILFLFWKQKRMAGLVIFFILGLFLGGGNRQSRLQAYEAFKMYQNQPVQVTGTVVKTSSPWRSGSRFFLRIETINNKALKTKPKWEVFYGEKRQFNYGQLLELKGQLFGEDSGEVTSWTRQGITGGLLVRGKPIIIGEGKVNPGLRFVDCLRQRLLKVGEETLSPAAATLLHGMLFGEREDKLTSLKFQRAGVAHLLSVSGLHLIFWLGLFWGLGKVFRLPDYLLALMAIPLISIFIIMAGGKPPALRAGLMSLFTLFGELTQRRIWGANLLSAAACGIMLIRPLEIFAPGFWLSFSACAGLIILYPRWEKAIRNRNLIPRVKPFLISLSAQMAVFPLTARLFGGISLVGPFSNLILVPLGAIVLQIGLMASVAGLMYLPVAKLLNAGNEIIIFFFRQVVEIFSKLPGYINFSSWPWMVVIAVYAIIGLLTWGFEINPINKRRRLPLFYILLIIGLLGLLTSGYFLWQEYKPCLELVIFNVGQGDAIFITAPGGYNMMIDGGGTDGYQRVIRPYLEKKGVQKIDLLVITHPHEDHLGGVTRLLEDEQFNVQRILESGIIHTTQLYQRFLELVGASESEILHGVRGTSFRLGELRGIVLNPPPNYLKGTGTDLNNNSLVLLLEYSSIRLLLTGDVEKTGEEEMVKVFGESLRSNILKVGHHGGEGGNSEEWLKMVRPEIALISVGERNPFGHPSVFTLSNLEAINSQVYRTDLDGQLIIRVKPGFKGRPAKILVERGN